MKNVHFDDNHSLRLFLGLMSLGFISAFFLSACMGSKTEVVHEQTYAPSVSAEGGADGAGGDNGAKGHPLESYAVNILANSETKNVLPILLNLAQHAPRVASDMFHILLDRQWYMVPFTLDTIPSQRLGVNFSTDQLALQNIGEVWVDSQAFDAMTEGDQGLLIVHECLIGLFFMRYQNKYDECLSDIAVQALTAVSPADHKAYDDARSKCDQYSIPSLPHQAGLGGGLPIPVAGPSSDDYEKIRPIVAQIWENQGNVDGATLTSEIEAMGLRYYPSPNPKNAGISP